MSKIDNYGAMRNEAIYYNDKGEMDIDKEKFLEYNLAPLQAKRQRVEDKIFIENKKVEALSEFKTAITKFKGFSDKLRNSQMNVLKNLNTFDSKVAEVISNNGNSSDYLDVIVAPGAKDTSYKVEVKAVAANSKAICEFSSSSTNRNGKITLETKDLNGNDVGANRDIDFTLTANCTIVDAIKEINFKGEGTLLASLVTSNNGAQQIKIEALSPGESITAVTQLTVGSSTVAVPAQILINDDNTAKSWSNVIKNPQDDKVTFILKQSNAENKFQTVNVKADQNKIVQGIKDFVDNYNNLSEFISKQTERDEDLNSDNEGKKPFGYKDTAFLGGDKMLESAVGKLRVVTGGTFYGSIGITKDMDIGIGKLQLDERKLRESLSTNLNQVRQIFEMNLTTSNDNKAANKIELVDNVNYNIGLNKFKLHLTTVEGIKKVEVLTNDNSKLFDGNFQNGIITFENTALEGLKLVLIAGENIDQTIDVTINQGITDKISTILGGLIEKDVVKDLDDTSLQIRQNTIVLENMNDEFEKQKKLMLMQIAKIQQSKMDFDFVNQYIEQMLDSKS